MLYQLTWRNPLISSSKDHLWASLLINTPTRRCAKFLISKAANSSFSIVIRRNRRLRMLPWLRRGNKLRKVPKRLRLSRKKILAVRWSMAQALKSKMQSPRPTTYTKGPTLKVWTLERRIVSAQAPPIRWLAGVNIWSHQHALMHQSKVKCARVKLPCFTIWLLKKIQGHPQVIVDVTRDSWPPITAFSSKMILLTKVEMNRRRIKRRWLRRGVS